MSVLGVKYWKAGGGYVLDFETEPMRWEKEWDRVQYDLAHPITLKHPDGKCELVVTRSDLPLLVCKLQFDWSSASVIIEYKKNRGKFRTLQGGPYIPQHIRWWIRTSWDEIHAKARMLGWKGHK